MTKSVSITDTGKRTVGGSDVEEKSNSGSAINLFGVQVSLEEGAVLNTGSALGLLSTPSTQTSKFAFGEVDHIGVKKPKWTLAGILRVDNATDMANVKKLRDLVKTKGYKQLTGDLADWSDGTADDSTVNVRIEGVQFIHKSSTNILEYKITCFETE